MTRYEIPLDNVGRGLAIAAVLLMMATMILTIWLATKAPEPVIPAAAYRMPKAPDIPDMKAQQKVDEALRGGK